MHEFDPVILRRLAARYRARALGEPDMAELFLEIASDMESHARRTERPAKR